MRVPIRLVSILTLLMAGSAATFTACNTVEGVGEDVESVGEEIDEEAEERH